MANRSFHRTAGALELETVSLWASLTIGSTGAVTASSGKGIASIARLSAGRYQINLQDPYNTLLFASATPVSSAAIDGTTAGNNIRIAVDSVASPSAPLLTLQFSIADGTATDPANGAKYLIKLDLKNSSVA